MNKLTGFIKAKATVIFPKLASLKLERLVNKPGNEMWRWGRGYNEHRPFFRIDWGNKGWRWTWEFDYYLEFYKLYVKLSSKKQGEVIKFLDEIEEVYNKDRESYEYVTVSRNGSVFKEPKCKWIRMYKFAKFIK